MQKAKGYDLCIKIVKKHMEYLCRKKTQEITSLNFQKFIASNKICVLRVQQAQHFEFSEILKSQLRSEFSGSISFGLMDASKLTYKTKAIREFVQISLPKIGLVNVKTVLPGFYLFKDGNLKAYHPATIDPNKIDPRVHGVAAVFGAIVGLIVGVTEKSTAKGLEVFLEAMEAPVSYKVFEFFKEILGTKNSSYSKQRQKFVYNQELLNAYKLLNVHPTSNDAEVTKAWKKLHLQNHPDLHQNDIEAKTKYCAELNNAYELIMKTRAMKTK